MAPNRRFNARCIIPQILPKKMDCIYKTRAYVFRAVSAAIGELLSKNLQTRRFVISSVLVMCVAAGTDAADVQILPGNSPIKIKGKLGDDTTFVGGLDVMASVGIPELIFRSTDLRRSEAKSRLDVSKSRS